MGAYAALWLLIPCSRPSVPAVMIKYSLYLTSSIQKYCTHSEQHGKIKLCFEKKNNSVVKGLMTDGNQCPVLQDLHHIHGFQLIIYAQMAWIWKSYHEVCNAMSNFTFVAKQAKNPLSCTTCWNMEPDFGMTVAQYITISLISLYHCLDPTNHDT